MIQLSAHFFAHEFLVSAKFPELALQMALSDEELQKLHQLATFALEPVRDYFNEGILIHSGKRSQELNVAVSGRQTSQHLLCEAADFHVRRVKTFEVYQFMHNEMRWPGQLRCYLTEDFIHVGMPRLGIPATHAVV